MFYRSLRTRPLGFLFGIVGLGYLEANPPRPVRRLPAGRFFLPDPAVCEPLPLLCEPLHSSGAKPFANRLVRPERQSEMRGKTTAIPP